MSNFGDRRVIATKSYGRVLARGLVELDLALPAELKRSQLAQAWRHLEGELDTYIGCQVIAA